MVPVARNTGNTLVFHKIRVRFRRYPGDEAGGAIGGATYVLRAGPLVVGGVTADDGSVVIRVPAGGAANLEILGSAYRVEAGPPPGPAADPKGAQERLALLGYRVGSPDAGDDRAAEEALLHFQADRRLDPRGELDGPTRDALERQAGG